MSRSYRHTKIFGLAGGNSKVMKIYKRSIWHSERNKVREKLAHGDYDIAYRLNPFDEWASPRDGKVYWENATERDMIK